MADVEEKISKIFDLFDKFGDELYIGQLFSEAIYSIQENIDRFWELLIGFGNYWSILGTIDLFWELTIDIWELLSEFSKELNRFFGDFFLFFVTMIA